MSTSLAQPTSNEIKREGLDHARRTGRTGTQQVRILRALYWMGALQGRTRQELADELGIPLSSICGRCKELDDLGYVEPIGTTGKPAQQVLAITGKGMDYLQLLLALTTSAQEATP